ncbi:MAG: YggS family pyridoxal phosphate-dependent enzyme [Desulfocapsa sp.]|nr:MAG: YggS family pyridoxal phosphate-dependent enzyme [Desulfocapsa sp.]
MSIETNLQEIHQAITNTALSCNRDPAGIKLLAVSKRHSKESIELAIAAGQTAFGENYMQEAQEKCTAFPDADFHFIGHVQSNKAKPAALFFSMVETVDRLKLAKALNKHLEVNESNLDILIQVNIGEDPNKHGVAPDKTISLLQEIHTLSRLRPRGLMTIPPFSTKSEETRSHFKALRLLANSCAEKGLFYDNENVELSMGMSHDFRIAIEEGSTSIRVGTAIFGQRPNTGEER